MNISAEITEELKVLNINLEHEGEIIMVSIPTKDNVKGMDKEILFSRFNKEKKMINGGTIPLLELFKLFKNINMDTKPLTEDDIETLKCFWEEKGDLERYSDFEKLKPQIQEEYPEIIAAWDNYKRSIKIMDSLMKNLEYKHK